ncbi:MAG: hypothetical protein P8078_10930, partial [bacterium]
MAVESVFNSNGYFWNIKGTYDWGIVSRIELDGKYKIAYGWKFNFPFWYAEYTSGNMESLEYITGDGQIYNLTNAITHTINPVNSTNIMDYIDGYRIYNESRTSETTYTRVIELVREKTVISCDVEIHPATGLQFSISNLNVYCPDGRILEFDSSGKISKIHDAQKKNTITFTYDSAERIDYITGTTGRVLDFDYDYTAAGDLLLTLSLIANDVSYALVKYTTENNRLKRITYLNHDNSNSMAEIRYDYTDSGTISTTITYPYGGESIYEYDELYYADVYKWFTLTSLKRPVITGHRLKASSATPDIESRYTQFAYYNNNGDNLLDGDMEDKKVYKTESTLMAGDENIRKESTFYGFDDHKFIGENKKETHVWEDNSWVFKKKE